MDDTKILKVEHKQCICCMEVHDVKTVSFIDKTLFDDEWVEYEVECFYCELADEYYEDEAMITANDIKKKDAYRKKVGLLESNDIKAIRSKYDISQTDLCVLLGWGGKTITRYESYQVQDKAHDSILKKIDDDPEWFLYLLKESKESFPETRYKKYYNAVNVLFEKNQDKYLRKSIEAKYAIYQAEESSNGNAELNLDKVVETIRYFSNAKAVTNLYKVKLMKLLWYADFLSYKNRNRAITGLVYRALPMGAVPIGHDSIIDLKGVVYDEIDMGEGMAYHFVESEDKQYTSLDEEDIKILDKVIIHLGKMSKDEIVSFMHKEEAYKKTKSKEIIFYEYAKNLQIG